MKLLIVTVVVVPWAAVVAVILAVLHHGALVGARLDAIHHLRPCPVCLGTDALVDADGWALCLECQASYQINPPTRKAETQ